MYLFKKQKTLSSFIALVESDAVMVCGLCGTVDPEPVAEGISSFVPSGGSKGSDIELAAVYIKKCYKSLFTTSFLLCPFD